MHPERALRVINLLDVPENKRKFWPQQSCVILRISDHEILDVIQFHTNVFTESEKYQRLYPGSVSFFCTAGDLTTVEDIQAKIAWCFEKSENAYVLGKGFVNEKKTGEPPPAPRTRSPERRSEP
jgi:hypothetical protein